MKMFIVVCLLAAVGSALPTSPQQDHNSLTRRGFSELFCVAICQDSLMRDYYQFKLCMEGCTQIAAEPGSPVEIAAVGSVLPRSPEEGGDTNSLARRGRSPVFCKLVCGGLWPDEDDELEYELCVEGCTAIAAEPGAPVDLDAIGSALPTPLPVDDADTKSLTRRGRSLVFCETVCSNLWPSREDDVKYELCVQGCTKVAAEPGAPVNLDDIEFGSGKA